MTSILCGLSASVAEAAVTLADADSLWRFEMPGGTSVGDNVISGQIVDSSGNGHTVSATTGNMTWASVPPTSSIVGPSTTGISFNPLVTALNPGGAVVDGVAPATFTAANASVSGSAAILTRFMWDGRIPGSDDDFLNGYAWFATNGYGGGGAGFLFGLLGVTESEARLRYLVNGTSGGSTAASSTFTLQKGIWYDIALIIDDGGDSSTVADNTVRFLAYSSEYGLQTSSSTGLYVSGAQTVMPSANMLFMSENSATGTGNGRKAFDGIVDYIAVFDVSMTNGEALAILGVPEPSKLILIGSALVGFLLIRRRN